MKKKDLFLICILLAAGMIGFVAFKGIQKSAASDKQMLKISVDGEVFKR
jgi:hypothetical protein